MRKCVGRLVAVVGLVCGVGYAQPIVSAEGVVEVRETEEGPWRPAAVGDVLEVGGSVRTLQGDARLELPGGFLRLAPESVVNRPARSYELEVGKAYVQADEASFFLNGPVQVSGTARFDVLPGVGARAVVLDGEGRVTFGGSVVVLPSGQQFVVNSEDETSLSTYFENDPWYLDLTPVGVGVGRTIGVQGSAEVQFKEVAEWQPVELEVDFVPVVLARTGDESWVELRFDDGSIARLQADTEVTVHELQEFEDGTRRSRIELHRGKVWAIVEGDGQPFEIETPGLVAGVRGTKLRVDAATEGEPPLLKTFEGEVAAVIGFETVEVATGEQFDPAAGVQALELDALDEFNLERDVLVVPPELSLASLPSITDEPTISVTGTTDALTVVVTGEEIEVAAETTPETTEAAPAETTAATGAEQGEDTIENTAAEDAARAFDLSVPLKSGFNLVEARASYVPDGATAHAAQAVIRSGPDAFLALGEVQQLGSLTRLSGVATPGAQVTLEGTDFETTTTASARGRFVLNILPDAVTAGATVTVTATSPLGAVTRRELALP